MHDFCLVYNKVAKRHTRLDTADHYFFIVVTLEIYAATHFQHNVNTITKTQKAGHFIIFFVLLFKEYSKKLISDSHCLGYCSLFKLSGKCVWNISYNLTAISLESSLSLAPAHVCMLMTNIKQTCFELHSD